MTTSQIRLEVRHDSDKREYGWVLQTTLPVTDEFKSCRVFATAAEAVADFEAAAERMGWAVVDGKDVVTDG